MRNPINVIPTLGRASNIQNIGSSTPDTHKTFELKRIIDNSTMEVIVKEVTELIQDPGAKQSLKEFKNKYGKDKIRKNVWKQAPRRTKKNLRKKQLSCDRTIKCSIVLL